VRHSAARAGSRRRTRSLSYAAGLALVSTSLSLVAAAPAHAAPVDIRLLNINDFHGRIDANTTKFATTIEQERAEAGDANTLFLSAGDNIGASLFASAVAEDVPTMDVLNALELKTAAVGNHEFDRGFADLTDRVEPATDFDYLGANVYQAGTTTPALPEYATYEVGGLTVGVVGAVTQETPSLVSPDGVSGLEFGDPVEAVNRVAGQLSDGDDANGEADVVVAEYHEGASAGTPDGASLEQEVAAGGAFASIVNDTSAEVDAIFTGHTHKQYAWDAPVPGAAGGTRPILQTGSYGEFIGEVDLTVDSETGEVTAYAQQNVARAAAEDTSLPRVAEVKEITDAALAEAEEVGNQPVGEITADITTAHNQGTRDDRSAESTLGDLVADALRDGGRAVNPEVDLGITNPGGLRAELLYAGDTATNPANTDGVVTYAEANAVLPFNNTVAIGTMTGAEIEAVLEQQWQPDGSSRPYLQLALSDNVVVTADATAPRGSRISSVRIDGEPIDPQAEYTVSTLSFLSAGGDNFGAFTDGEWSDTGLLDAELWRTYLQDNSPVSPDFARQQVFTSGIPGGTLESGSNKLVLGPDRQAGTDPYTGETLDLTSLGAPANTEVVATGTAPDGTESDLGTFPVTAGTADVTLDLPETLVGGTVTFTASPSGTTITLPVQQGPTAIADVQGTGATSPMVGETVTVEGVVTADYGDGGFNGFYVQTPGTNAPAASDAIFVFARGAEVAVGDSVRLTGKVSEYQGLTEITAAPADISVLSRDLGTVAPHRTGWTAMGSEAAKEAREGELIRPNDTFTVSDNYDANAYGSFGLARGTKPLVTPTEVADAQDANAIENVTAANERKKVTLDDGSSTNYNSGANKSKPLPWLTPTNPVRVGSQVTFHQPLVLDYRYDLWNLQPQQPVTDDGADVATFSDTRADNLAPKDVGGDIKLATFNVLNYFPTTGEEIVDGGGSCTWYSDRFGNPVTVNTCTTADGGDGPRGAANAANLERQEQKIVRAINSLDASIVGIEELENSVKFGKDRDVAIGTLVDALNAAAGAGTWAYAPSPAAEDLPPLAQQDVIRLGLIYKPADVELVGDSKVLTGSDAFGNARQPLVQGFKAAGAADADQFLVSVNHFKSKGSGVDDGTGQGNANPDRVAQADALVDYVDQLSTEAGTDKVFLMGDFNAYSMEDPVQVIEDAGYTDVNGELNGGEATYNFDGMDGSLDHVFASESALAWVTGVDVWQINAQEQVGFEYSRFNNNKTQLYQGDNVFRASDHNPEIVGLDLPATAVATVTATAGKAVYGRPTPVTVTVDSAGSPTGTVTISEGSKKLASGALANGTATLSIPKQTLRPGKHTLTVAYSGDGTHAPATTTLTVTVAKAAASGSAPTGSKTAKSVVR